MGNSSSNTRYPKYLERMFGKMHSKICIVGLDAAGKTTILYKLKTGKTIETMPGLTAEFNVEEFQFANVIMRAVDVSGASYVRGEAKR